MDIQMLLIAGLLALVILLCLVLSWSLRRAGGASRARNFKAIQGEEKAEELLALHGYRVIDRQVREKSQVWLDGEPLDFEVRVDLLVERDRQQYVAEVKTGSLAPNPGYPPTRRQLREYARVFDDCGILLVDVDAAQVMEVCFEEPR
jgi:hypothetical protein